MAKDNITYKVTTGGKAYSFHDQSTGISLARGEVKELTARQFNSTKIQRGLNTGHLIRVQDKPQEKYTAEDIEKLNKRLMAQIEKGMEVSKMAKGYSLDEMKRIAEKHHEIVADKDDTVETLIQAIVEDFDEGKKDETK